MKRLTTLFIAAIIATGLLAQAPQKMSYQAVVRNTAGELVTNQNVGMKISILQGSPDGTLVYQEIYNPNPQTNANGLLSLEIGEGTPLTGDFSTIDWSNGPYFLMTETDPAGGTNYSISGTSQLLSVPYALYANSTENYTESDPVFDLSAAADITGGNISDWNAAWDWGNHASAGYVPDSRILTINGTALDLTANRSWDVGTVSSVGLVLPDIFQVSGSPVSEKGTLSATFSKQSNNLVFASPVKGLPGSPAFRHLASADIPELNWSKITTGLPTTLAGYGITDAATKAYVDLLKEQVLALQAEIGVSDKDGNHYNAIKIGTQVWMAENLKTTRYNDGTAIPLETDNTAWGDLATHGYCWYNNDATTYKAVYGALYNWYAVNTDKLCPTGWHVPSDAEWTILTDYLIYNGYGFEGSGDDIGKSVASVSGWMTDPTAGNVGNDPTSNNSSGFNAPPGGFRSYNGPFYGLGSNGHWWSSTAAIPRSSWRRNLSKNENIFERTYYDNTCGFSVRCIKD